MKILVVGAGAIGGLVGGRLAAAGHDVTLVVRERLVNTIADSGLRLNISGETIYVPHIVAVTTVDEAIFEFGPFDLILFTMKSYDTTRAIKDLQSALSYAKREESAPPPLLLSLQNGVGNEGQLSEAFGADRVIAGVITAPAEMPVPGVIRAASGAVGLAALDVSTPVQPLASAIRSAGFETRAYADWRAMKWTKLLLNILGNATSAILDWTPAQIFSDVRLFDLEWAAWQETLAVMEVQGIQVTALPGYPLPRVLPVMTWMPRSLLRLALKRVVAGGRGGKMPSLHVDLSKGKSVSEVTVLNGAVVKAGQQAGVPTPVNRVLTETLVDIVQGRLDWDAFRGQPDELLARVGVRQGPEEPVSN